MTPSKEQIEHDMRQAAFEQNHLAFRSLNQQMWQIPLISMTLTGGLWFGVSRVEEFPLFQLALLFLAAVGNAALFVVILRLRFVMEQYLKWLETNYPSGFVSAHGQRWYHRPFVVRTSFQGMLLLASALSLMLLIATGWNTWREILGRMPDDPALMYYEEHASSLADGYEALTFEAAHPGLAAIMAAERATGKLRVLDIGAGQAAMQHGLLHENMTLLPSNLLKRCAQSHNVSTGDWRSTGVTITCLIFQRYMPAARPLTLLWSAPYGCTFDQLIDGKRCNPLWICSRATVCST